jgi:glycosyltransferase involved in cell wall biosynthesis
MSRLHITYVTDYLSTLAGTEASLVDTALSVKSCGHKVTVAIYPRQGKTHPYWSQQLRSADIAVFESEADENETAFCHRLRKHLFESGCDIVHVSPIAELAQTWLRLFPDLWPIVGTETSEASSRCTWYDPSMFEILGRCRAIVARCQTVERGIRDHFGYKGRTVIIPHLLRVPEEELQPMTRANLVSLPHLGAITRLRVEKGPEFMVAALAFVPGYHNATLTIYGETTERDRTLEVAQALGVSQRLHLAGTFLSASEMPRIVSGHCLFLLSSLFEGLPQAVLNAVARGRPVVATDVGGVREVLQEIDPGLIVPAADPRAMADAIGRLLDGPDLVLDLSRRAVEVFRKHFHITIATRALLSLYEECTS